MAYRWKILRAAVEQEILFPSAEEFERYVKRMENKGELCEVSQKIENEDGTVTAIMRKAYNNNAFLSRIKPLSQSRIAVSSPEQHECYGCEFFESDPLDIAAASSDGCMWGAHDVDGEMPCAKRKKGE